MAWATGKRPMQFEYEKFQMQPAVVQITKNMKDLESHTDNGDNRKVRGIINAGADIAGAAVGGAIGFLAAGPAGAAIGGASGAAAAHALRGLGEEAANRLLGPREKVRVGGALAIAAAHIRGRVERGERLREDDFFDPKHNGRSDAEEIAESVLLRCQREAEERKIPYMAFLIGNISFDGQISSGLAHQLVRAAEDLTYRQLCVLKIAALHNNYSLREADYRGQESFQKSLYEVLYECVDLYNRSLIAFGGSVAFGPTDVKPSNMSIQGIGADLFNQMGLATIPQADLDPILSQISK